jgi:hypothetical protein
MIQDFKCQHQVALPLVVGWPTAHMLLITWRLVQHLQLCNCFTGKLLQATSRR